MNILVSANHVFEMKHFFYNSQNLFSIFWNMKYFGIWNILEYEIFWNMEYEISFNIE